MALLDRTEIREKNTGWRERNGISKEAQLQYMSEHCSQSYQLRHKKNSTLKRHLSENIKVNMTVSMIFCFFFVLQSLNSAFG